MTTATKLDGTRVAADIKHQLAPRVGALHAQGVRPGLGTILVGDDPGSLSLIHISEPTRQKLISYAVFCSLLPIAQLYAVRGRNPGSAGHVTRIIWPSWRRTLD